ncbi:TraG family conjugative transposon ATPase [Xanthovirga aplysinae]|uniref:TraG family conjugative transposon ATPase n=1 Tax=Xanthovirga aplysinae TaxID=2529853 RepID=UPI0012BBD94A|nr:TraG family conjugative transposon ATPase [Xanthovirga aplysinae]MTI33301.1 TraG family conjugative transposon ATPase [Xanthovirga aplysinae]
MRTANLKDYIPIDAVESVNGVAFSVSKGGDVTGFFRLSLPEVFTLSNTDLDQKVYPLWLSILSALPKGITLHKLDSIIPNKYGLTDRGGEDLNYIDRSMEDHFYGMQFYGHECYIMLSYSVQEKENHPASSSFFKSFKNGYKNYQKYLNRLLDAVLKLEAIMNGSGLFKLEKCSEDEVITLLKKYFTGDWNEKSKSLPAIELIEDYLKVGRKNTAFISLIEEGETAYSSRKAEGRTLLSSPFMVRSDELSVSSLFPLSIGLAVPHVLHQLFYVPDQEDEMKRIKGNRRLQLMAASKDNLTTTKKMKVQMDEVENHGMGLVRYYVGMQVWADSKAQLDKNLSVCESAFRMVENAIPFQESRSDAFGLLFSLCPGAASDCYRMRSLPLQNAATFLASEGHYRTDKLGLTLCDRRGLPNLLNLWSDRLNNKNRLVVGGSGGGKSFLNNHILYNYYHTGHHCIILDIGNSYKRLCHIQGGEYREFDINQLDSINPFGFEELTEDNKTYIRTLLSILWLGSDKKLNNEQSVVINQLIEAYYSEKAVSEVGTFHRFYDYVKSNSSKFSPKFDFESFLLVLGAFTKGGSYASLFSDKQERDTFNDERFLVFELGKVKDHELLYPVLTLVIINTVIQKMMKGKGYRTTMVLDEAWASMTGAMGEFIEFMFRTCRKHNGETIVITQAAEDLENSPIGKAIIRNVETLFLLEHSDENRRESAQRILGLTDHEVAELASIDNSSKTHKEVFIRTPYYTKIFRVQVSPEAVGVFTTKKEEVDAIQADAENKFGGNLEYAIDNFAANIKNPV